MWPSEFDFTQTYGGAYGDTVGGLVAMPDEGVVFAGSYGTTDYVGGMWVVRTDTLGVVVWEHLAEAENDARATAVMRLTDGHLLAVGSRVRIEDPNTREVILTKLTEEGDAVWTSYYPVGWISEAYAVTTAPTGETVLVGNTHPQSGDKPDCLFMAVDSEGQSLWEQPLAGPKSERLRDVAVAQDGALVAAGEQWLQGGTYDRELLLLKFTHSGELLWNKAYPAVGMPGVVSVATLTDGGFILASHVLSGAMQQLALLIRTEPDGSVLWEKTYGLGGINAFRDLTVTDTGLLLAGHWGVGGGIWQIGGWVVNMSFDGDVVSDFKVGTPDVDELVAAVTIPGNRVVAAGTIHDQGVNTLDVRMIKFQNDPICLPP